MALTPKRREELKDEIADALERLKTLFGHDSELKATCILRSPNKPDGNIVVTEDSFDDILAAIERENRRPVPTG